MYRPDNWVVIKFKGDDPHYRVLVGWSGGYLDSDSWRMNSGIVRSEREGDYFNFYGSSGSCYKCYMGFQRLRMNNAGIWNKLKEAHGDDVEMIEGQPWVSDDWDWILK